MRKEGPGELAYFCACPRLCLNLGLRFPRTRGRKGRQLSSLRESYSQKTAPRIRGHPLAWDGLQIRSLDDPGEALQRTWDPPCSEAPMQGRLVQEVAFTRLCLLLYVVIAGLGDAVHSFTRGIFYRLGNIAWPLVCSQGHSDNFN